MIPSKKSLTGLGLSFLFACGHVTAQQGTQETELNEQNKRIDAIFSAIIEKESGGKQFGGYYSVAGPNDPTESPAGAIGISQLMPEYGAFFAKLAGLEWHKEKLYNDPQYNFDLGRANTVFLAKMFDFDPKLIAAAYNCGQGCVKKAIKKAENLGLGTDEWLQFTPKETINYVPAVMSIMADQIKTKHQHSSASTAPSNQPTSHLTNQVGMLP
jgi:hypothetical protein